MSAKCCQVVQYELMKDKKQFWSLTAVVFLAVVMPTILKQVNKITRTMAGAEGRLASINIETDRIFGKIVRPFVNNGEALDEKAIEPDQIRYLFMKLGQNKTLLIPPNKSESYLAAIGCELINTGMTGKISGNTEIIKMFDRLGSQRLQFSGTGSWIFATATKKENTYQVILANYDPRGLHSEVVPVNFLNLEQGKFEFRKTFWGSETTTEKIATDAGLIQRMIPMIPNSVVFLELEAK